MSIKEKEAVYMALKESNDLEQLFPTLTGSWAEDAAIFTALYDENERFLEDSDIGDIEEDFDNFY